MTELDAARGVIAAANALYRHWALCTCKSGLTTSEDCRGCRLDRALDAYRKIVSENRPDPILAVVYGSEGSDRKDAES